MQNHKKTIINLKGVTFGYGDDKTVFSNVNLDIQKGSFHFLTGKSGAGKSSFLKLLYLEAHPSAGQVDLFGKDTVTYTRKDMAIARQYISIIFQDYKLLPHLNNFDNVALPLRIKGETEEIIAKKVHEILAWVDLEKYIDTYPETLSGGQQQRLSIARSIIANPKLILADEPTGNVDDTTAIRIMSLLEQLHKHGTTIIMATHNEALVKNSPHSELHIENGHIEKRKKYDTHAPK